MAPKQSRAFCFTLNNPPRFDLPMDWFAQKDIVFAVWQVEAGANGTEHLQGYVVTKANDKSKAGFSIKWCKENLNGKAHWEVRMGTHQQAVDYCKKVDTRKKDVDPRNDLAFGPWTVGEWKDQETTRAEVGERAKKVSLLDVKESIDKGATEKMLWDKHFSAMTRYSNAFKQYQLLAQLGERRQPYVLCFWGEPGCGKSQRAKNIAINNGGNFWYSSISNCWWDGYNPAEHNTVVLDDFKGNIPYTMLLRMLDCYPLQCEVKGSTLVFNPAIIIITSNTPPNQWYFQDNVNFDHSAILRRLQPPYGKTFEMKKTPGFVKPDDGLPNIDNILDDLEKGTFYEQLKQDVGMPAPLVIDLTEGDFIDDDEEAIARAEQASLAVGDYEEDSYEHVDAASPTPNQGRPTRAVSITRDLDRDFNASPQFISAREHLKRTDEASLTFNTPQHRAGSFKKLGPEKVQSKLAWAPVDREKRRKIMVSMKSNNDDDDGEQ